MNKKLILILLVFIGLLVGLTLRQKSQRKIPMVVSLLPLAGASNVHPDTKIEISFEETVNLHDFSFQMEPSFSFQKVLSDDQRQIILNPERLLRYDTLYIVKVIDLPSNQTLANWSFTTRPGQDDPEMRREIDELQQEEYPLLPFTPPDDASFYFLYTGPRQLKVFLKGDAAAAKQEVLEWISSKGVDPASHQIEYVIPGL